jgi:hypothetical protein
VGSSTLAIIRPVEAAADCPLAHLTAYELRYLIAHLAAAGRDDDIHRLLRLEVTSEGTKPHNAWYRAKVEHDDTEGFLADLEVAGRLADVSSTPGLELRYAIVAASIRSLAANVPPPILLALVQRRIWPVAEALSHARASPRPERRCQALTTLAEALEGSPRRAVLIESIEAAREVKDEDRRGKLVSELGVGWVRSGLAAETLAIGTQPIALLYLVERLADFGSLDLAVTTAHSIDNSFWRMRTFQALAERLPGRGRLDALRAALAAAAEAESKPDDIGHRQLAHEASEEIAKETAALSSRTPHVHDANGQRWDPEMAGKLDDPDRTKVLAMFVDGDDEVRKAEDAVRALEEPDRIDALAWLVRNAPEPDRARLVHEVLSAGASSDHHGGQWFAWLVEEWTAAGLYDEALEAAQYAGGLQWPEIFARLVPRLSDEQFARALRMARDLNPDLLLPVVALHAPEQQRGTLAREAIDACFDAWPIDTETVARLVPLLGRDEQVDVLRALLAEASRDSLDDERVDAVAVLAPQLTADLLDEAYAIVRACEDADSRERGLAELAPYLGESQLRETLLDMQAIDDKPARREAAVGLLIALAEAGHREQALQCGLEIGNELAEARIVDRRRSFRDRQLERLTGTEVRLRLGNVSDGERRIQCLVALAPLLARPLLEEACSAALTSGDAEALAELAPFLLDPMPGDAAEAAIARHGAANETGSGNGEWSAALEALALRLAEVGRPAEAIATVGAIEPLTLRAESLAALASSLPESARIEVLREATEARATIPDSTARSAALAALAPYLPADILATLPREARDAAAAADAGGAATMASVVRRLPTPRRRRALMAATTIVNDDSMWRILSQVPEAALEYTEISAKPARAATANALAAVNVLRRADMFAATAPPTIEQSGEPSAADEVLATWLRWATGTDMYRLRGSLLILAAPLLSQLPLTTLRELWREALPVLSSRSRPDLLTDIGSLGPVIEALGGAGALRESLLAIEDVGRWWP